MVALFQSLDTPSEDGVHSVMGEVSHIHELTDEELLLYAQKHPSAFEFLVARYQQTFLHRALAVIRDKDDAEDIVQDAFVRIYRFAPRFSGEHGTFKAWGMTILMNIARTRYQKRSKEWTRTASLTQEHYESLPEYDRQDALQAKDIIERALVCLPEDVAHILRLAFLDELPYQQIAEREGISVGAVKTRVHRAKKQLKNTIGSIDI